MSASIWSYEVTLAPKAHSIATARRFVEGHLASHDLAMLVDDIVLVASELATNVLTHALTPFTVSLAASADTVILVVKDGSPVEPVRVDANSDDDAGRGVAIVDVLSREWGVTAEANVGKSVWAAFDAG